MTPRLVLIWCLVLKVLVTYSQDFIEVSGLEDMYRADDTYIWTDTTDNRSFNEVIEIPLSEWNKDILATYSPNIEWILVPFKNSSEREIKKILYLSNPISHKVDLFFTLNGKALEDSIPSGLARSSANKLYNDPGYPYEIVFPPKSELFVYLKVHDPLSSIQVPVFLLESNLAYGYKDRNLILLYFWLGVLTLSIVLALVLYLNTRQVMFIYYFLFAVATGIIITSTTGMVTMFIDSDPYQIVTNYYQWGAIILINFMPRFINSLVSIEDQSKRIWRIVQVLGYIGVGIAVLYSIPFFKFSFFFTKLFINCVVSLTAIIFLYVLISLGIATIKRKSRAFPLFIVYLIYLSLGFINVILPLFGLSQDSLNSIHVVLAGSALEVMAFMIFMGQAALDVYKQRQILLEQVRDNQELVMQALVKGQEEERNRFARDLHDGFGQMISALNLNLKGLQSLKKTDSEGRLDVYNVSADILKNMHEELKNICFDLMPQTLVKHGLVAAIEEFASRINASGQKHVEVVVFGMEQRLNDLQEISIYRITQEWVNNILKYSNAEKISIQLTRDENEVTVLIEDDGMGFDQSLLTQGKGNGWKNIQSRANLISGEVEMDTNERLKGNTFILNAPLKFFEKEGRNEYLRRVALPD